MRKMTCALLLAAMSLAILAWSAPAHAQGARTAISIYTSPGGGVVFLDNQRLGPAPILAWATALGPHKITIEVNGRPVVSKTVNVTSAAGQRFTIALPKAKTTRALRHPKHH